MTLGLAMTAAALAGSLGTSPSTGALDDVYAPRRVAVLIGVDSYADPALTPLRFAAKDAQDLGHALEDPAIGGFDRVMVVTGADATTSEGIAEAIAFATSDLQRDDTFLLYLSGHGTLTIDPVDGTQLWFLPSDGQLGAAPDTGLAVSWLEEQVATVEARRRVLIMDTCHNGRDKSSLDPRTAALLASMRGEPPAPRGLREVSESEARLFAAQYYQPAMEDPNLGNGVYTHFLIEALTDGASSADLDGDGLVDVTEAHDWARDKTIHYTGGMQVPRAEYRVVGREDIYLAGSEATRSGAERALLAATDALLASARVLVDGQPRGVLPEVVTLEPGRHDIEIQDQYGRTLTRRSVRVQAGETVMAEDLLPSSGTAIEVTAGAGLRHGPGQPLVHPAVATVDAALVLPQLGPPRFVPELHAQLTYGAGTLEVLGTQQVPLMVRAGELTFGVNAGWQLHRAPITVGPSLDAGTLYRQFRDVDDTGYRQAGLAISPGAQATLRLDVTDRRYVVLRYEAHLLAWRYQDAPYSVVHHGLSLGVGARP
ncbi:MAG: caspase family protein [Alphaproteobacteria bacterium]|nr:caspase family protein [Alphaproteobacteria bacterium]MCB9759624.1 caspase family protein [Alphaproteobacteria bacterium]